MADNTKYEDSIIAPARRMWLITPHDTNVVDPLPKALRFDAAGTVVVEPIDTATTVTLTVLAGEILPLRVRRVLDTGSDALVIHGLV